MSSYRKPTCPEWTVLEEQLYDSFPILSMRRSRRLNLRTQQAIDFVLVDGLDWSAVVALTPQHELVLTRQYRHGIDAFTLELPGGCVESGEDPGIAALRELHEETGFSPCPGATLEHLSSMQPNPAMLSNRLHYYLLREVEPTAAQSLDPGENIDVVKIPLREIQAHMLRGEFQHALHYAGIAQVLLRYPELI
jgi:ADP-ribose pyrophosphatase